MSELHTLSATALLRGYMARQWSPVDVMQAVIDQVQHWEPQLQATYLFRPEAALEQARASEARWQRRTPQGWLDGIPATIKDNIATAGDPTPLGTAATLLVPAAADAPPAARLREAGAVLWAKTTMPDFGMLSSGLSSFHATARNPWDLSKGPGGSSAGAGAAAAAGYGPLHVGTDIGGSIRLPASWCGIVGFKPSLGRIPIDPPYTGRCAGPMTRSVEDAALMMMVLAQPDARDCMALPPQDIAWEALEGGIERLRGLRFGLLLDAGCGLPVAPEVRQAIEHAAVLLEQAGAIVEPMPAFLTREMLDGMDHFWRMRSHIDLQSLPASQQAKVLPFIRQWAGSASSFTAPALFAAQHQFFRTRQATVQACAAYDYVLSPVAPITAFDAELPSPTNDPLRPLEHIAFTVPFNMSEQPAISVPCAQSSTGLPISLQIAGPRFDDLGVLQIARAFEQLRGPLPPYPLPPATTPSHGTLTPPATTAPATDSAPVSAAT